MPMLGCEPYLLPIQPRHGKRRPYNDEHSICRQIVLNELVNANRILKDHILQAGDWQYSRKFVLPDLANDLLCSSSI